MLNRTILPLLRQWKNLPDIKPLILRGARQVGKTTAVELFSSEFENYIYLNLELGQDREIFEGNLSVHDVFQAMQVIKNVTESNFRGSADRTISPERSERPCA